MRTVAVLMMLAFGAALVFFFHQRRITTQIHLGTTAPSEATSG
jgi:hypothetical protein